VTASEIAEMARVTPSAVSNWRKRYPNFPPVRGTAPSGGDLFSSVDIQRWLRSRDASAGPRTPRTGDAAQLERLWVIADRLRGQTLQGDLAGAVAAGALLLHKARELDLPVPVEPSELGQWAGRITRQLEGHDAELVRGELFTPLASIGPAPLGQLLHALSAFRTRAELARALDFVSDRVSRYTDTSTDADVASLLAQIAQPAGTTFDPAAGAGELLIRAEEAGANHLALFGQEVDASTWRVALARLALRGVEATIALGDSLTADLFPELRADVVLCEPPAGVRTPDLTFLRGDPRWSLLGTLEAPPSRASDFIWLAHVISHLDDNGRGYVLLPAGSLFRGGTEARLRSELVRQGVVEAIVSLPRVSTPTGLSAPLAVWIVRAPLAAPPPVLFMDATDEGPAGTLLGESLGRYLEAFREDPDGFQPEPGFATTVPVLELLARDISLVPGHWVYSPDLVDTGWLASHVTEAHEELIRARSRLEPDLPPIEVSSTDAPAAIVRIRDLLELGVASLLKPVKLRTDVFGSEGLPVWLPADVKKPWRRPEAKHFLAPELADPRSITQAGDIVFTTIGGLRTHVDREGGVVLGTSLQALRVKPGTFDPHALAALLMSERNQRLLTGTTIPRVNVLELAVPELDLETSRELGDVIRAFEDEEAAAADVAARADELRQAIIDAVSTGTLSVGVSRSGGSHR
jgi:type I restriction-modification system DNA methylase subunit